MLIRQQAEQFEYERLSPRATKAADSRGRQEEEEKCEFRTDFQRDRDRIIHSKSFRRLMHKTQVFLAPEDDHYRTRLTHTLEVAQVARTVARSLGYNEDLTEAIALGHDLGHTPFGHAGEKALSSVHPGGFAHNIQSLRTVDKIEVTSKRRGLNLTYEVRDGILNHRADGNPCTPEGEIVKICDRIAYINHDIDDAIRSGILKASDLPKYPIEVLGSTHSDRINNLILDLCRNSEGKDTVSLDDYYYAALMELRRFMFSHVYKHPQVLNQVDMNRVEIIIGELYEYFLTHTDQIPGIYRIILDEDGPHEAVKDLISGMTDRYALMLYDKLFMPINWR